MGPRTTSGPAHSHGPRPAPAPDPRCSLDGEDRPRDSRASSLVRPPRAFTLGIETSCDETAVAVLAGDGSVLCSLVELAGGGARAVPRRGAGDRGAPPPRGAAEAARRGRAPGAARRRRAGRGDPRPGADRLAAGRHLLRLGVRLRALAAAGRASTTSRGTWCRRSSRLDGTPAAPVPEPALDAGGVGRPLVVLPALGGRRAAAQPHPRRRRRRGVRQDRGGARARLPRRAGGRPPRRGGRPGAPSRSARRASRTRPAPATTRSRGSRRRRSASPPTAA